MKTKIMGILNVTPDSFQMVDNMLISKKQLHEQEKMIAEGADYIDIGGESTRPGSENITEEKNCIVFCLLLLQSKTNSAGSTSFY